MDIIKVKRREFKIKCLLKEDSTHKTYLVFNDKGTFIVKVYTTFLVFSEQIAKHKQIKKYGITVPKLIKADKKSLTILYQYIEGENMLEKVSKGDIEETVFDKLFNMYRFARFSKIDLNYMPENYVMFNNELYYLSHEVGPQMSEKNLENYGIRYWLYTPECVEHLKEHGYDIDKKRILNKGDANKKIVLLSIMRW